MFSDRDDPTNSNIRVSGLTTAAVLYLGAEVLVTALVGLLLGVLALVRRALPKPPRDIKDHAVVVTGAESPLGKALAREFTKAGCVVACIDNNFNSVPSTDTSYSNLTKYQKIEELGARDDFHKLLTKRKEFQYKCNTANRTEVLSTATEIHRDIGHVNILVSCAGDSEQNILDVASTNLMSHYWTMLAFIPSMIKCEHSHIVAVIPTTSKEDAYMGSKAAVAGLIEAIGQQLSNANHLTFTTVAPKAEPRLMKQSDEQTAKDIVEAVRRNRRTLTASWQSGIIYPGCYRVNEAITSFTEWLYRQRCDDQI